MSDFRLKEIALLAGKDARTIRRWCEEGLVRGAFRIGGQRGHWRIRSGSALEAAEQAAKAAEGFSRNRGKRWESAFRRFAKSAAKIQRKTRPLKLQADKINRTARRTSRMIRPAANAWQILHKVSDDRLAKVGWSRRGLKAIKDKLMPEKTATKLIETALSLLLIEAQAESRKIDQREVAERLGMTLRRFRQDYSSHWNSVIEAFEMTAGISAADGGYVTDPDGDQCGEVGAITYHESATDDDLRAWRSGALQLQGARSDD